MKEADRIYWVEELKQTYQGDANFDLRFTELDFVTVFVTGKYLTGQDAGWSDGDSDGNGRFDEQNLVRVFVVGDFLKSSRGAVATVPEPSSFTLLLTTAIVGAITCRRHQRQRSV